MSIITAVIITSVLAIGKSEGVDKRWVRTWDLDDKGNWEDRKLPCRGKTATLPIHPSNTIFLGARVTVGILELPESGQFIFGDGANLVLDDGAENNCQDTKWVHHGPDSWWDPKAWSYPHYDDSDTSPVPHVHRVPCTRDTVLFTHQNQSLYSVHLSPPAISVSKLKIGEKEYTTSELASYMRSLEGSYRFKGVSSTEDNAPLYIEAPSECSDITGCLCGTEDATNKICNIMKQKCPSANCINPIKMTGFCCEVCGAEVTVAHNGSLALDQVQKLLKKHLTTPVARNIVAYSAKMNDNLFHVYFTAINENGNYKAASVAFRKKFEQELSASGQHTTLLAYSGRIQVTPRRGPSANSVAASFITLAVCLALGLAVYYLKNRRITSDLSFMFRRLESSSRRVSVISDFGGRRLSTASSMFLPSYSREGGLRFLNPIYNQSIPSLVSDPRERPEGSVTSSEGQAEGQHENPMYIAYENMTPDERQASEDALKAQGKIIQDSEDIIVDETKQEIVHELQTICSTLDVISEEKLATNESENRDSTEEKEKYGKVHEVYSFSQDLMDENSLNTTNKKSSDMQKSPNALVDLHSSTELQKEDVLVTISDSDIGFTSCTPGEIPETTEYPSASGEGSIVEKDTPDTDKTSLASTSSSSSSIDIQMDIKGFVPKKDIGIEK
ncbi:hypothetical protein SK128_016648 [Halocaridina rubra]|uniref:Protein amnionless n=1 Tax=Halocaridina rubra TaxID=373956 RepID=A0AAN8ZUV5_HALRR